MAKVPHLITPIPAQPNFFIAPSPAVGASSYTIQLPQVTTTQCGGITPVWPPSLATPASLRPQPAAIPAAYTCPEVYFAAATNPPSAGILPVKTTSHNTKGHQPTSSSSPSSTNLIRRNETPPSPAVTSSVKTEKPSSKLSNCKVSASNDSSSLSSSVSKQQQQQSSSSSYPINALIDVPTGTLNRGSRTSSLSSSLSSFRFGGSLSQLWATSLSSLSNKVNNMKSTGNLHAEASMPSLGNQYFAFGGSLPELSLTSLTRLLPNSTANTSTDSSSGAPGGLYTLIQSPLCVYPSQSHLATPFINANGSITFGSFLSSGSSLCSSIPKQECNSPSDNRRRNSGSPDGSDVSPTIGEGPYPTSSNGVTPPGNLSTLAYVASVQKTLESNDGFPLMTVATHLPSHSPIPPPHVSGLSPIPTGTSMSPGGGRGGEENTLEMDCQVNSPSSCGYPTPVGIKLEEEEPTTLGSYTEVKPPYVTSTKKEPRDKPYKCDYPGCGRSFSFPAHLRSHVQQIHISYRPCKCDFPGCGKRFYTPQHLNVHRRIHTGERPFVCPYADCGKAFTTAGNLKNHIRTHTGEKPYGCKFEGCSKRFAEMSSLKKHELTHTGEKPYKCRVCSKAFSQAGSRNTHERKHSRSDETDSKLARRYRIKRVSQDQ